MPFSSEMFGLLSYVAKFFYYPYCHLVYENMYSCGGTNFHSEDGGSKTSLIVGVRLKDCMACLNIYFPLFIRSPDII